MIVRAGDEDFFPRLLVRRRDAVAIRELVDLRRREAPERELRDLAEQPVAVSVQAFEVFEQQHEFLDVRDAEPVIDAVERVRDGVREPFRGEVFLQLENIAAPRLQLLVLRLGDAPHEHVDFAAVVRESRADLLADEGVRPVRDLEAAVDAVVIGDRHEIHSALLERIVQRARRRVAVRQPDAAEKPLRRARAVT